MLAHSKQLVRDFAAETLGFLIKRISGEKHLQHVLNYILLPPALFVALIDDTETIEITHLPCGRVKTVSLTQNDHDEIAAFKQ